MTRVPPEGMVRPRDRMPDHTERPLSYITALPVDESQVTATWCHVPSVTLTPARDVQVQMCVG